MKLLKFLFGLVWWATVWMLCAKKTWKALRKELSWKTSDQKIKIIWNELVQVWKELSKILKDLPENEQIKELTKLWEKKLSELIKNVKKYWFDWLNEYLPVMQEALSQIEKWLKEKWVILKKQSEKKIKNIKKWTKEIVKKIKKKVS